MSLWTSTSGFLAIKPKVKVMGDVLYARTSMVIQFLTLFSYAKQVRFNWNKRSIEITKRRFWALTSHQYYSFDDVKYIIYDYGSFGTSWGFGFRRTDEMEWYKLGLMLKSGKQVKLFTFFGEGSVETGWLGMILDDDSALDMRGDQDEASYNYLELLEEFLQVPVNRPETELEMITKNDSQEITISYQCQSCGRSISPPQPCCPYCGGTVQTAPK